MKTIKMIIRGKVVLKYYAFKDTNEKSNVRDFT
jgi:hypothetical protein